VKSSRVEKEVGCIHEKQAAADMAVAMIVAVAMATPQFTCKYTQQQMYLQAHIRALCGSAHAPSLAPREGIRPYQPVDLLQQQGC